MHFVSASIYYKAIQLALSEGLPSHHFAHHAHEPQGTKYVPIDRLFDTYELADQHLTPGFGIRQGRLLCSEDYGTLGLSWRTCWRAREVLDRLDRFMILVTDHGRVRLEESEGFTKLILYRDANRRGVEMANEVTFVMLTTVLNEITGRMIRPIDVYFKHASEETVSFSEFFQCPVHFKHRVDAIQFRNTDIDIPTLKADRHIHQYLLERMDEERLGIQANADRFLSEIYKQVTEALPGGIPSVIQMADHLGMSARTLKRRLSDKSLTFRDLVQKIQCDTATNLLRNTAQSMIEIAFQTGFSEQSAFNRAFKRWTGYSPADYRKNT